MITKYLMSAGLVAAVVCVAPRAWADDSASQAFLKKAIEGNMAEVKLGQLAQQKAASDKVKEFGQALVTDHTQANEKAMQAASSMSVTPPTQPSSDQQSMYDQMSKESGAAFDRAFIDHMVKDHQTDIADYEKEGKGAKDAASQYANDTLPTLRKHLSMAQSEAQNLTAPSAAADASGAAPAAVATGNSSGASPSAPDMASQAFIKKAIAGNMAEVKLGQLAQQKAASDRVKQFGQQLVTDHTQANEKAMQAASSMSVTPPTQPSSDQQSIYDQMSKQSGATFDHDFVDRMVKDHQQDIADYQKEMKDAKNAVSQYASDTLPSLQKHLSMAQALEQNTAAPATATNTKKTPAGTANNTPATTPGAPLPGANSFTEGQAKSRIEGAGFANVMELKKDDQGIWRGKASRNGTPTAVSLDYKGNVTAQ